MKTTANNTPVTVIILVDALGWEVAERFGFCKDLLPRARAMDTVLGYSSAAIPSLLSGQPPSSHGIWAMYRYDPIRSPFRFLRHVPRLPHALEWRVRVATKWVLGKRNTIRGYFDLYEIPLDVLGYFDVSQHGDPYEPGGMNGHTFFDELTTRRIRYKMWNYRTAEEDNFAALEGALAGDSDVLFFYTAELDALMHRQGIFHPAVASKLAHYEDRIRALVDRAQGVGRPLSIFLFSDHGMTDVREPVDLMARVEEWGFGPGSDILAFYDSTMARFWCSGQAKQALATKLNETGWGHVMTDTELEHFGCRFEDRAYGDLIFLLSPGRLIIPSFMGSVPVAAMHGYHPDDRYSKGCFMTNVDAAELPQSILELKRYLLDRIGEAVR